MIRRPAKYSVQCRVPLMYTYPREAWHEPSYHRTRLGVAWQISRLNRSYPVRPVIRIRNHRTGKERTK